MAPGRPENPTIAACDNVAAAVSAIRAHVAIVAARQQVNLTRADIAELSAILDACDRIVYDYLAPVRKRASDEGKY